eukprot:2053992-Prymnesium_polylepis.2
MKRALRSPHARAGAPAQLAGPTPSVRAGLVTCTKAGLQPSAKAGLQPSAKAIGRSHVSRRSHRSRVAAVGPTAVRVACRSASRSTAWRAPFGSGAAPGRGWSGSRRSGRRSPCRLPGGRPHRRTAR